MAYYDKTHLIQLQLNNRDVDLSMVKVYYLTYLALKNDYIGQIGSLDFHFLTGAPPKTKDYLTVIKPFDPHVWAFILASSVAVSIALIFINHMHATWSNKASNESAFQSSNINKILKIC